MNFPINRKYFFKSIRSRLTFYFIMLSIVPLILYSLLAYNYLIKMRKATIYNKLEAIRDIEVHELTAWINEQLGDIRLISRDNEIHMIENISTDVEMNLRDREIVDNARMHLERLAENHSTFHEVFIVSMETKKILVSTNRQNEGKDRALDSYFTGAIYNRDVFFKDINYSDTEQRPSMALSIPVFSLFGNNQITGVLVISIDLEKSLYHTIKLEKGLGDTGEIIIVNKEHLALNKLREHIGTVLNMDLYSEAVLKALQNVSGIMETVDYRGKPVLAAYTYIPQTKWGFIVKQDIDEVFAPIYELKKWTLLVVVMTAIGVVILAFAISVSISKSIEALDQGTEIIGSGNLDHKVGTDRLDEIGKLSRKFDQMIEKIKLVTASRDELNHEIAERRRLEKAVFEVEEQERQRIGYDLHDGLGQLLTGISFKSQYLKESLKERSAPETEDAERITFLIDRAKDKVKLLSKGLSPTVGNGEESLMLVMKDLVTRAEEMFNVHCRLICDTPVLINNESAVANLYRIAQEAITNAVKHASSENIEVCLERIDDEIILSIKDDGNSIREYNSMNSGMGLGIMKYRANIINASFDIRTLEGGGTLVKCIFNDKKKKGEIL